MAVNRIGCFDSHCEFLEVVVDHLLQVSRLGVTHELSVQAQDSLYDAVDLLLLKRLCQQHQIVLAFFWDLI